VNALAPRPTGKPDDAQGVNSEYEVRPKTNKSDAQFEKKTDHFF
jgi:hypothetical protein